VIGTFLAPLDSSIVNIALPSIASQFGRTLAEVSWVTTAYLLTSASLLLSMGRAGDMWGLRRLYVTGLLVFGGGSLACAASPTLAVLVGARVLQAVGASMLFAAGPALVARTFPPERRGWALGYVTLAVSAGLTVGPALGGILVGTFGWPSIFLINVPLTVVVAIVARRLLPSECPVSERFDVPGALLAGVALLLFLFGLTGAEHAGVFSAVVLGPVAASGLCAAAFIWWERRAEAPMVDLALFRVHEFTSGIGAATLAYLAVFSITFTMPFYLLRVEGVDSRYAGLVLTVLPLAMAVLAPIAGRTSDRRGSRGLSTLGMVVLAAGLLVASMLRPGSSLGAVAAVLAFAGSGMALFQTPNTAAILRSVPRERTGVASALIAEARNVGMAVGIAVTAAIIGIVLGGVRLPEGSAPLPPELAAGFSAGMAVSFRVMAGVAMLAAALSWFGKGPKVVEGNGPKA
jgi:EmrB/QacA subfamily drug resistance transporter